MSKSTTYCHLRIFEINIAFHFPLLLVIKIHIYLAYVQASIRGPQSGDVNFLLHAIWEPSVYIHTFMPIIPTSTLHQIVSRHASQPLWNIFLDIYLHTVLQNLLSTSHQPQISAPSYKFHHHFNFYFLKTLKSFIHIFTNFWFPSMNITLSTWPYHQLNPTILFLSLLTYASWNPFLNIPQLLYILIFPFSFCAVHFFVIGHFPSCHILDMTHFT